MFNHSNPYTLRTKVVEGTIRYYVSFVDVQAILHEVKIAHEVYLTIDACRKHEKRQRNFFDRYIEHSDLTDETLHERVAQPPKSVEEVIFESDRDERFKQFVAELPEVQRRRLVLRHELGLTYEQIAEMEGCTKVAVKYTVDKAQATIVEKLKNL